MADEEAALAQRARDGDRDAFGDLVEAYAQRIFALSVSLAGDFHAGEDAAQETFLRAFKGISGLKEPEKFGKWLVGIAYKVCLEGQRKNRKKEDQFHSGTPDNLAFLVKEGPDENFKRRVMDAANSLDDEPRALLALKYLEGLSYAEMGEILGADAKTIKSRLFAARRKLRDKLGSYRPKA